MNQIALIYRKPGEGRKSIESLFLSLEGFKNIDRVELPYDLNSILNFFKLIIFALKIKQKFIHISGDVHYMAIFLFWKKIIITVHDSYHYESLSGIRKFILGWVWFKLPLKIANRIIAVSPTTKGNLIKNFNIDEKKIIVIPNTFNTINPTKSINSTNELFDILVIGTKINKNVERLIEATKEIDNVRLRIIGRIPKIQVEKLETYKIHFINKIEISDKELAVEYQTSNLLFTASIQEGFCLPILEAQSVGIPVITSNKDPMKYVAGDGALLVDPFSIESIKDGIIDIKENKIDTAKLIENGYINISRFSKKQFIDSYLEIYRNQFRQSK